VSGGSAQLTQPRSLALLTFYLLRNRDRTSFLVAASDAKTADPIALASGQPVITIGGFSGADPTPTAAQLAHLVSSGRLRYVLLDAARVMPARGSRRVTAPAVWVQRHCARVPSASIASPPQVRSPTAQGQIASVLALFDCADA
jgi:4-amino-4-deoxy-L-arabinose transferase-like glycosyltransferase